MAIGIVQLAVLVARVDLGPQAWALFGAARRGQHDRWPRLRREYWPAPPLALALALLLLLAKASVQDECARRRGAIGITLIFGLGGLALALWRDRPLWTAIACAGLAGPALIVRAARPELLERPAWGGLMLALAAGPAASALAEPRPGLEGAASRTRPAPVRRDRGPAGRRGGLGPRSPPT